MRFARSGWDSGELAASLFLSLSLLFFQSVENKGHALLLSQSRGRKSWRVVGRQKRIDDDLRLSSCQAVDIEAVVTLKCSHLLPQVFVKLVRIGCRSLIALTDCCKTLT